MQTELIDKITNEQKDKALQNTWIIRQSNQTMWSEFLVQLTFKLLDFGFPIENSKTGVALVSVTQMSPKPAQNWSHDVPRKISRA